MKIKGVIEHLKLKKKKKEKNDHKNSKSVSRTFSGVAVGIVGSVHFLVPWSGLYFSRSIGPFLCSRCLLQGFNLLHLSLPRQFPRF